MSAPDSVTLPYLDLSDYDVVALTTMSDARRWQLLSRLFAEHGHQLEDVPAPWSTDPLRAWSRLVLPVNGIEVDADHHELLTRYGIDVGFSSSDVRRWIWAIA